MLTHQESTANDTKNSVVAVLSAYGDVDEKLVQRTRLGENSFEAERHTFEQIKDLLERLSMVEFLPIPIYFLRELNSTLHHLGGMLSQINKFDISQNNWSNQKLTIIRNLEEHHEKFSQSAIKVLSFNLIIDKDRNSEAELTKVVELREKVEKASKEATSKIETVLATIGQQAQELGISRYAGIFKKQAEQHKRASTAWLVVIIVLLVGTLIYGVRFSGSLNDLLPKLGNNNYVLLLTITRLLILTVLFYGISLGIRNYKAHKHNEVINRHRHNALITFETFSTAASSDPDTKNAILLEATRSIFSSQHSGYSSVESDGELPASKIIEIIKSAKDKS